MAEEALVRAFQMGDSNAFAELFDLYKNQVLRTAFLIVGNHCDSENVLQEVFIKVWCNLSDLKDPTRFKPWLWRIVTRTAWAYCRKRDVEQPVASVFDACQVDLSETSSLPEMLMRAEHHNALLEAINSLELKQKTVVILYYYNELSVKEIAAATGALPGTVKSRLFAARRNLRQVLGASQYFTGEVDRNEI